MNNFNMKKFCLKAKYLIYWRISLYLSVCVCVRACVNSNQSINQDVKIQDMSSNDYDKL